VADGDRGLVPAGVETPAGLAARLAEVGYLADDGLATAAYLALRLHRPLFCEGEAGVGKTELAKALAALLAAPLIRLQCYEGIDASQALYDWDFPRQLLHLRAAEAAGVSDVDALEAELYSRRFLVARPLLAALETTPSVLLIDEVDRADDEFEAFLLEVLSDFTVTVPELGTLRAETPPVVVITSNRTRDVHDALKRRCYYHWLEHPDFDREVQIVRLRVPAASRRLAEEVTAATQALRGAGLLKPPGIAETIDWAQALTALGATGLEPGLAAATLGAVVKYREDAERAQALDVRALVARAVAGA
jgi:MoxR-like ATPase